MNAETEKTKGSLFVSGFSELAYPFRKDGIWRFLIGMAIICAAEFATFFPFGSYLQLFSDVYMAVFFFAIAQATGMGEEALPPWPSVDEFVHNVISPLLLILAVFAFSALPMIIVFFINGGQIYEWRFLLAAVAFAFIVPLGMVNVCASDSLRSLSPVQLFRTGFADPANYGVLALVGVLIVGFTLVFMKLVTFSVATDLILAALLFFTNIFYFRLVGLYLRWNQTEIC